MRRLRIAVSEISPQGGLLHYAMQLADALAERGHDVDLIVPRGNELGGRPGAARRLEVLPGAPDAPAASGMGGAWVRRKGAAGVRLIRTWWSLIRAVRAGRYDVLLSGSDIGLSVNAAGYLALTALPGRPPIAFVHHNVRPLSRWRGKRMYASSPLLKLLLRAALRRFELVIVNGEASRQQLDASDLPRIEVIPLPDWRVFAGEPPPPSLEERLLFFGYWNRAKGLPVLMDAFDLVAQRRQGVRLTIAGAPSPAELDPEDVRRWAAGHGDRVTLVDRYVPMDEVPELFSCARVVAAPYLASGYQSGVVRLAMSMARPVVASNIGELPGMLGHGVAGETVPPGDAGALASALESVVMDPEKAGRLGAAARERVLNGSSVQEVAERVEAGLTSLVGGSYAAQTYDSRHLLVRYPHRQRFRRAVELVSERRPAAVLDYGAGDCQFLLELLGGGDFPERAVAYNPPDEMLDVPGRLREMGAIDTIHYCQDLNSLDGERFDVIVCLSVLEHLPLPERERFYELCGRALQPGGRCVIEVPIEIGPTLLVKEWGRRRLKHRAPEYSGLELARLGIGAPSLDPARSLASTSQSYIETHKGFDYRLLRRELEHHFDVLASFATPFKRLPAWLVNQEVFFVARPKRNERTP